MDFIGVLERMEPRSPERLTAMTFRSEDRKTEVEVEVPDKVLGLLRNLELGEGVKVKISISKRTLKPEEWDLLMKGVMYVLKTKGGVHSLTISIGGLRCHIRTTKRLRWKLMDELYVGIRFGLTGG